VLGFYTYVYALNIDKVKINFLNGDYKAAILEGEKILAHSRQSPDTDELYYFLGLSYLKEGNSLRASDIFEIILSEFKDSRFRQEALRLNQEATRRRDNTAPGDYYTVQVGCFANSANALNLRDSLIKDGYQAYIEETGAANQKNYRVRIGKLNSRAQAESLESQLQSRGLPTKICP
jgi:outer membrane protein assembly factor BamD (BamD/ComL family)